jgi:hypothetical protein
MTGKLKTKGNMMLATKLDGVLKVRSWSFIAGCFTQYYNSLPRANPRSSNLYLVAQYLYIIIYLPLLFESGVWNTKILQQS